MELYLREHSSDGGQWLWPTTWRALVRRPRRRRVGIDRYDPAQLVLEITESVLLGDQADYEAVMIAL